MPSNPKLSHLTQYCIPDKSKRLPIPVSASGDVGQVQAAVTGSIRGAEPNQPAQTNEMDPRPSSSTMNPIFENQDVLPIILSFFDPEAFCRGRTWAMQGDTRRNLLSAALTSKAFLGPAISLLWRQLDSVMPLLKLFPNFVSVNDIYVSHSILISVVEIRE